LRGASESTLPSGKLLEFVIVAYSLNALDGLRNQAVFSNWRIEHLPLAGHARRNHRIGIGVQKIPNVACGFGRPIQLAQNARLRNGQTVVREQPRRQELLYAGIVLAQPGQYIKGCGHIAHYAQVRIAVTEANQRLGAPHLWQALQDAIANGVRNTGVNGLTEYPVQLLGVWTSIDFRQKRCLQAIQPLAAE